MGLKDKISSILNRMSKEDPKVTEFEDKLEGMKGTPLEKLQAKMKLVMNILNNWEKALAKAQESSDELKEDPEYKKLLSEDASLKAEADKLNEAHKKNRVSMSKMIQTAKVFSAKFDKFTVTLKRVPPKKLKEELAKPTWQEAFKKAAIDYEKLAKEIREKRRDFESAKEGTEKFKGRLKPLHRKMPTKKVKGTRFESEPRTAGDEKKKSKIFNVTKAAQEACDELIEARDAAAEQAAQINKSKTAIAEAEAGKKKDAAALATWVGKFNALQASMAEDLKELGKESFECKKILMKIELSSKSDIEFDEAKAGKWVRRSTTEISSAVKKAMAALEKLRSIEQKEKLKKKPAIDIRERKIKDDASLSGWIIKESGGSALVALESAGKDIEEALKAAKRGSEAASKGAAESSSRAPAPAGKEKEKEMVEASEDEIYNLVKKAKVFEDPGIKQYDKSGGHFKLEKSEDGKSKLVRKDKREEIHDKVKSFFKGEFANGSEVGVDFNDYVQVGEIKSYLGDGNYRVFVAGDTIVVPRNHLFKIDAGL